MRFREIHKKIEPISELYLSYRAVTAWEDMAALVRKMSASPAATVMVQEQLALALNRIGQDEEAERILLALLERRGLSSETTEMRSMNWRQTLAGTLTAMCAGHP
jgi:MAP3K TRAFs-binding domain